MLADIVDYLACPVCRDGLRLTDGSLRCGQGHGFDVARQGYVSLLTGSQAPGTADSPAMVAARADFLAAGHYAPLADALAKAVQDHCPPAATGAGGADGEHRGALSWWTRAQGPGTTAPPCSTRSPRPPGWRSTSPSTP
ncbi:hypothetical protein GCM10020219_015770 [Nonomuraea dietziae]